MLNPTVVESNHEEAVSPLCLERPSNERVQKPVEKDKLTSLTSLRFFAAAMIVVTHSISTFHLDPGSKISSLPLSQGVSFFFVLSGFILSHVYRNFDDSKAVLNFLIARVARIWPVFLLCACATYFVHPELISAKANTTTLLTLLSQFFMLHGWIPARIYYFALNAPSWSVSTEFFFYLIFPLLIFRTKTNRFLTLLVLLCLPISMIVISSFAGLPDGGPDTPATAVSSHGLIYINPLSRLLEFYLGILTCRIFRRLKTRTYSGNTISAFEFIAIAAVICNLLFNNQLLAMIGVDNNSPNELLYLRNCGGCITFAVLIAVIGLEQGFISKFLKLPLLVFLGEISYAMYLLHYHAIDMYYQNAKAFDWLPRTGRYGLFWLLLIGASALVHILVEKPARTKLRKLASLFMR